MTNETKWRKDHPRIYSTRAAGKVRVNLLIRSPERFWAQSRHVRQRMQVKGRHCKMQLQFEHKIKKFLTVVHHGHRPV